jgi:hypothetical protein
LCQCFRGGKAPTRRNLGAASLISFVMPSESGRPGPPPRPPTGGPRLRPPSQAASGPALPGGPLMDRGAGGPMAHSSTGHGTRCQGRRPGYRRVVKLPQGPGTPTRSASGWRLSDSDSDRHGDRAEAAAAAARARRGIRVMSVLRATGFPVKIEFTQD